MLRTQPDRLAILIAARELARTTLGTVLYANASLHNTVCAAGDGAEAFARTNGLEASG